MSPHISHPKKIVLSLRLLNRLTIAQYLYRGSRPHPMDGKISYEDICTKIRSLHPRILLCGGTLIKQVLNFSPPRQNENTVGLREEGFHLVHYKLVLPPLPPRLYNSPSGKPHPSVPPALYLPDSVAAGNSSSAVAGQILVKDSIFGLGGMRRYTILPNGKMTVLGKNLQPRNYSSFFPSPQMTIANSSPVCCRNGGGSNDDR